MPGLKVRFGLGGFDLSNIQREVAARQREREKERERERDGEKQREGE